MQKLQSSQNTDPNITCSAMKLVFISLFHKAIINKGIATLLKFIQTLIALFTDELSSVWLSSSLDCLRLASMNEGIIVILFDTGVLKMQSKCNPDKRANDCAGGRMTAVLIGRLHEGAGLESDYRTNLTEMMMMIIIIMRGKEKRHIQTKISKRKKREQDL